MEDEDLGVFQSLYVVGELLQVFDGFFAKFQDDLANSQSSPVS